jgi:hypothetical protein
MMMFALSDPDAALVAAVIGAIFLVVGAFLGQALTERGRRRAEVRKLVAKVFADCSKLSIDLRLPNLPPSPGDTAVPVDKRMARIEKRTQKARVAAASLWPLDRRLVTGLLDKHLERFYKMRNDYREGSLDNDGALYFTLSIFALGKELRVIPRTIREPYMNLETALANRGLLDVVSHEGLSDSSSRSEPGGRDSAEQVT